MDKFNRNYNLFVQKRDQSTLKIELPFTLEFDVHRNSFSSASTSQFRIYNLSPNNRSQIRRDEYDTGDRRDVSFKAGYGDKLAFGFIGNISHAWSVREGNNIVSQIECYDGGFAYINAITSAQFKAGTPQKSIITALATSLKQYGVSIGSIGDYSGSIGRGNSYVGSTMDVLSQITGGAVFIDNGKLNVLKDNECIQSDILLINAQTGLLGTPLLEQQFIHLDMLFEPALQIGQLVLLETSTADAVVPGFSNTSFNGIHKVISLHHRGTISEAVCGEAITSVGLLPGVFTPVPAAS